MINKKFLLISFGLLLILITSIYFNKIHIVTLFNKFNLLPREEKLTELYFEHHLELPSKIEPGKEYFFDFAVHNLENKDFNYEYSITAESSENSTTFKNDRFSLKHDGYKIQREKFSFEEPIERTKISVNLKNKNQSIHFWVEPVAN